jgi:hypothetical protein
MAKYSVYHGSFRCHVCKVEVATLRSYPVSKELTWMCPEKHLSSVSLQTKKNRKDFENES